MHIQFWSDNLKGRDHSEDLGVDERISGEGVGGCGLDSSGSGQGPMAGSWEHGNELLGSTEDGEFLD